jgi:hypothetical protein
MSLGEGRNFEVDVGRRVGWIYGHVTVRSERSSSAMLGKYSRGLVHLAAVDFI